MTGAIDPSRQRTARVAGAAYLIGVVAVVWAQFAVNGPLSVAGNGAATARNILANERLFRIANVADLVHCAATVVFLSAVYAILRPVNQNLAFFAAMSRLLYALTWFFLTIDRFRALLLLKDVGYARSLGTEGVQAMMRLHLSGLDGYYVGLLFWSLSAAVVGWLWYRSGYVPRILGLSGAIASAWCAVCTVAFLIDPDFRHAVNWWWWDSPMAVVELATSVWLLVKGVRSPGIVESDAMSAHDPRTATA
jgi:hypothetical protein